MVKHILIGQPRDTAHDHPTAAEARDCQDAADGKYDMEEPPSCPICDAWGCGGARGMGCDRYERGPAFGPTEAEEEAFYGRF